ncbi:DUF6022 family protein [Paenibacillus flagellatus]|uniref:Uncharacterized protein n=1 Tax=Paenibacillus flagellatus TaxID=2211139 RepID=A0A2V5KDQ6_9BACL|nr:DUF6022 family protein [Paenibacillus flagellatus]PYI52060.1 hypothetical protein DLM86_21485 [Paenibacillus flagellatus]
MTQPVFDSVVRKLRTVMSVSWKSVLEERREELAGLFAQYGDRAYGVWIQQFMAPVFEQLTAEGYIVKGGFNRNDSVENWGPPEERERCVWYVVKDGEGAPIGTMVLQVYHSHRAFHVPRAPRLFALEETERERIVAALSDASVRVRWDLPTERQPLPDDFRFAPGEAGWEYATDVSIGDCLRGEDDDGQTHSWSLDDALSHWGRYGWQLVSVVPAGGRIVAFFKRPLPAA